MRLLDKYIIYSSIFALFSEDFKFHYIIDFKLFYLIMLSNLVLLALKKSVVLHKNLGVIIGFFIIHGIFTFALYGSPLQFLFFQIIGISLSSIFYYSILKCYGKKLLFEVYLKVAFINAFLAIPMFYLKINQAFGGERLNGFFSEPAHYAAAMLPAAYVFLKQKKYLKFFIVVLTIMLSKSSIGYVGVILMVLIPLIKMKYFLKYSFFGFIILSTGFFYVYSNWDENVDSEKANFFLRRVKQTVESFSAVNDGEFEQSTNLSSYALISNSYISKESFLRHPLGTGLGSYETQYNKYYPQMSPPKYLLTLGLSEINKADANSLFLRMLVDLGFFSLILYLYFFYKTMAVFKNENKIIEQGVFFYLIVKTIREGHYFPPEFYFFLLIFLKDFDEDIAHPRGLLHT